MNTIILFWNPEISSYTIERLREDLENYAHVSNWSVWEHDKAHKGDRFFMVRCGEGKTGICMSGRFRSEPYRDEDWSGKGREVYYMDLRADTVIDSDILPILSTEVLSENIPSFDWSGGHSGRLLPAEEAEKLEQLWAEFLEENQAIFGRLTFCEEIDENEFDEEEEDFETQYREEHREQDKKVVFNGEVTDFEIWFSSNNDAGIFAIRGEYSDEEMVEMSRVLEKLTYGKFYVDISELNIHREAVRDRLIRTYEDDIIQRLYYNEEIPLLEKMIINRKHGNIFEKDGRKIFCDNGKVLVHIPIDQEVEINEAVEIIGRAAVIGNKTLETLEFPSNVHIIGDYAFAYCEDLSIVRMHDGITSIGENSFDSCSIKQLRLSSSLSEIPVAAFKYNEDLETIEIPASVKHIGEEAFLCDYIEDVVIPEGVETIDYAVFTRTLKHINLPSTLKWIAYDFYYEEMIDDPEEMKPYVDIHPDNPVYFSKGGILYSRETGKEVLGKAGRPEKER